MAAPALAENRIACPACGQLIHPIAGRCKHCKADLTRHRAGGGPGGPRPRLVALGGEVAGGPAPATAGPAPAPTATAPVYVDAPAPAAPSAGGWSRRWPLVVAAIAILAILVSLTVLVLDLGGGTRKKSRALGTLGPAPESMQTDPLAPRGQDVPVPSAPTPTPAPDPVPAPTAPDPVPGNPLPPPSGAVRDLAGFLDTAVDVGCRRLTTCTNADPLVTAQCSFVRQSMDQMKATLAGACPAFDAAAAARCLDSIAAFPCPSGTPDPSAMATTLLGLQGCSQVCGPDGFGGVTVDPDPDPDPLAP